MQSTQATLPSNVPAARAFDYDMYSGPEVTHCPHQSLVSLLDYPDIFYTSKNGGHWVVTRQRVAVDLLQAPQIFSNDPTKSDASVLMTAVKRVPLDIDPPDHAGYRKILNSMFSPKVVKEFEPAIRAHAARLVDSVYKNGKCEFLAEIAQRYPPEIFLGLLGIPVDRRRTFISWVDEMTRSADPAAARAASSRVAELMREILDERRAQPGNDIISRLLGQDFEGRPLNQEELVGISVLLFIGGLDTVVALLSFMMLFLAENTEHRAQLVARRDLIPDAIEEMSRRFSISCIFRYVAVDAHFEGVDFKAGDRVLLVHPLYGIDDREIEDPLTVNFERPVSRHTAFGAGPHRCLGSHLARLELRVFLEEWLNRIPDFKAPQAQSLGFRGGKIIQPITLPFTWDVA